MRIDSHYLTFLSESNKFLEEQNTEPSQETESPEKPKKRRNLSGAVAKKPAPKRNKKPKSKEKKTADPNRERSGYVFSTDRHRLSKFQISLEIPLF